MSLSRMRVACVNFPILDPACHMRQLVDPGLRMSHATHNVALDTACRLRQSPTPGFECRKRQLLHIEVILFERFSQCR
jgi:hypothetical protein